MTTRTAETSPQLVARLAGALYFMVVPLGIFGALYVASQLIVSGDAAATAGNIRASETLFRLGIVSDMLATLFMSLTVLALYRLLKPVNPAVAQLMVMFVTAGVSVAMVNQLNRFAALSLISRPDDLSVFTVEQAQALAHFFLRLHARGSTIAFIFWGVWLFPLGYLVFKSGFLPKVLGVLLMIACLGYVVNSFSILLGFPLNVGMFAAIGEIAFILWLLIKGVDVEQWNHRALQTARGYSG